MYKGVEFYEEGNSISNLKRRPKRFSFITGLAIKLGLAKDEQSANVVLVIVAVAAILLTIVILTTSANKKIPLPNPEQMLPAEF
ncbi:MAG: hypothetical protein KAR00_00300 [Candidatus Pacebacteria bacterium]|nr:hypothetical protein [Candidatus Paceibacterota bacterium]